MVAMMIPEQFRQYWMGKRRHCRHQKQQFDLTLEHAWLLCEQYWHDWLDAEGRNQWIMSRLPGYTAWEDYGVQVEHWTVYYEKLTKQAVNRPPGQGDVNMQQYTEQPVSVEIDGVEYPSINSARKATGIAASTIRHRCASTRFPNYRRLEPKNPVQ
jgi:hypothetical protein